jgi:hypothetical protein
MGMPQRKYIQPGTRLPVRLSSRDRDLIVERALLDPEVDILLRQARVSGTALVVELTLDDIDDLLGCVAAEANHCEDGKVRRALDAVCDRLGGLLEQFTDEPPSVAVARTTSGRTFTAKQGQYLAFIYWFTKIHRQAPAEADLQRYFRVSAPGVHEMILTLERRGLITREPGKARSISLRVARTELPELE